MRVSSSGLFKTLCTLSSAAVRLAPQHQAALTPLLATSASALRYQSMPLPSLSSFFSSTASTRNMSYPLSKSDGEWQAQLSPGKTHRTASGFLSSRSTLLILPPYRAIPRPAQARHRSALHLQVRLALPEQRGQWRLHLRRLRRAALQGQSQVQVRLRLAGLFRRHPRRRDPSRGPHVRHGPHRDRVQQLRWASGPRVQGRGVRDPDG